jgi:hypothetical protein
MLRIRLPLSLAFFAMLSTAALAQDKSAPERQADFLKGLQEGKIPEAFAELLRGSLILQNKAELENLITQTEKGLKLYGGITAVENLGLTREHKLVAYGSALVGCEKGPLFFYFIWYRPRLDAPWRAQNVWFDDNSRAFFEGRK